MPAKAYIKKPVRVEAMYLDPNNYDSWTEAVAWCGGEAVGEGFEPHIIAIETLEGTMYADIGNYIIKGIQGEFYPCKPNIFDRTYDEEF